MLITFNKLYVQRCHAARGMKCFWRLEMAGGGWEQGNNWGEEGKNIWLTKS